MIKGYSNVPRLFPRADLSGIQARESKCGREGCNTIFSIVEDCSEFQQFDAEAHGEGSDGAFGMARSGPSIMERSPTGAEAQAKKHCSER